MIRREWLSSLLEGLIVASASAVEDDEESLMALISDVIQENVVCEKGGESNG